MGTPEPPPPRTDPAVAGAQAATPSVTGVPSIDAALGRLDQLDGSAVADHVSTYEQVHTDLRDALDEPPADQPDSEAQD